VSNATRELSPGHEIGVEVFLEKAAPLCSLHPLSRK
jgi:hypothetical protein